MVFSQKPDSNIVVLNQLEYVRLKKYLKIILFKIQGIKSGDYIEVSTKRGSIKIRVREDRSIPQGVLFIPFCYNEAAANLLTNPALDPFGKIPEYKYCAAKITFNK